VRDDGGEVVGVGADQGVPGEQPAGADARVGAPVEQEGGVGGVDGEVDVRGVVVGGGGPDVAGAWVCGGGEYEGERLERVFADL
jgi:hypothetical protein